MRDDCSSPKARKLTREGSLETRTAQGSVSGPKGSYPAVVGQHAGNGTVREHDDLVDETRERTDLRHRGRERRVPRVDLLGDEDELRQRAPDVDVGKLRRGCEAAAFRDLRAPGDSVLPDLRTCALEEIEVAEREVPRVGSLVDTGTVVERLADEAKLLVRGREACPSERTPIRS